MTTFFYYQPDPEDPTSGMVTYTVHSRMPGFRFPDGPRVEGPVEWQHRAGDLRVEKGKLVENDGGAE